MSGEYINDSEQLKRFQAQFKSAVTVYGKIQNLQILINSPQPIIDKFSNSSSMKTLSSYLKESLKNLPTQEELVEKIMILLQRINLNEEILKDCEIAQPLIKMKDRKLLEQIRSTQIYESVQSKWSKYYTKYQRLFEDWKQNFKGHKKTYDEQGKKKVKRSSSSSVDNKKNKKKNVRFAREDQLIKYKYFKKEDEPNQKGMTQEEVNQYQKIYAEELKRMGPITAYDIKHRESLMEGRFSKQIQDNVSQMNEQIPFTRLYRLRLPQQDFFELNSQECISQEKKTQSKIQVYYRNDNVIPSEPNTNEIQNQTKPLGPMRMIHLDPPKREDLMYMVQVMCDRAYKELEERNRHPNRQPMKSILKKPPDEKSKQQDQLQLAKMDLEPKMQQLTQMIDQKQNHSQETILSLLHDILQKVKEMGQEQYIKNVKQIIETRLNSATNIQNEDLQTKLRNEQMKFRLEQLQSLNPIQAQRIKAYKTKHCHNYHSAKGCTRGEACNFIHDPNYQGMPVPSIIPNISIPNLLNKNVFSPQVIQTLLNNAPPVLQSINPASLQPQKYRKYESL